MTIAENASLRLSCFTFQTLIYSINTLHLKKGKKKTKNPEVTDMSGSFWKELRLAATLTGAGKSLCSFLLFCYSKEENQVHIIN